MQTNKNADNPQITIAEFVESSRAQLNLEVPAGKNGLYNRTIDSARIQKLGLALAGFANYTHAGRIQIVGQSEISYLAQLEKSARINALENLELEKICCILITKNLEPPVELLDIAEQKNLPVLRTAQISSIAINAAAKLLAEMLAPQITVHGVLIEIYGLGVLITGASGIGKSECALDLITRGHRLIADDAVMIKKFDERLEGTSPELTCEYLEIRGIGIVNVRDLFGVSAIGKQKNIELVIEFKKWNEVLEVERLGLNKHEEEICGVKLNKFVFPVSAGRNLSTLVETAVRVHLLRENGFDAAQKLIEKHTALVASK